MPSCARKEIFDPDEVGVYHCYSRCVRQEHLLGDDRFRDQDNTERKQWIDIRLRQLQQVMMVDLFGYAFLDNHLHLVLRNRPDLAQKLSNREVARRALMLNTHAMPLGEEIPEPTEAQIRMRMADRKKRKQDRENLSSISHYHALLKEPISRRANAQDGLTGHFWEERFGSVRLLDSTAVMLCLVYVDLNEIRAGIASQPEKSTRSSIYERLKSWKADRRRKSRSAGKRAWKGSRRSAYEPSPDRLAPINEQVPNGTPTGLMTEEVPRAGAARPGNTGFLPMTLEQYFELCDWTGRQIRQRKKGSIPAHLAPILKRLTRDTDVFLDAVQNFRQLFGRFCGSPENLARHLRAKGAKHLHGLKQAQRIYPEVTAG